MKKAILIDVENKTVYPVNVSNLESIQKLVGGYIERAHVINNNDIYVNEDGLVSATKFFFIEGAHQPFAGNGLIVGHNDMGETADVTIDVGTIRSMVKFFSRQEIPFMSQEELERYGIV